MSVCPLMTQSGHDWNAAKPRACAGHRRSNGQARTNRYCCGAWGVSIYPPTANVPCTPHRAPAGLAFGGSGHADTANSCSTHSASCGGLLDDAVQMMKRRGRHGLRRRCYDQGKCSNGDQSECCHCKSPRRKPTQCWGLGRWLRLHALPGGNTGTKRTTSSARRGNYRRAIWSRRPETCG